MINTETLQSLTNDCREIDRALAVIAACPHSISVYAAGWDPVAAKSRDEPLPYARDLPSLRQEVRDLVTRRLTEAMQAKVDEIRALCAPKPPTMADVVQEMRNTPDDILRELGAFVPPSIAEVNHESA